MKKIWYGISFIILLMLLVIGYNSWENSSSQQIKVFLVLIGGAIILRLLITPIVAILVQRHDRLKQQKADERKNYGK